MNIFYNSKYSQKFYAHNIKHLDTYNQAMYMIHNKSYYTNNSPSKIFMYFISNYPIKKELINTNINIPESEL